MSTSFQNNHKCKRKAKRIADKKKAGEKEKRQQLIKTNREKAIKTATIKQAMVKPPEFPKEARPKKKNKNLVQKFKDLFKRKIKK
jgi:hypothetical protein